MFVYYFSLIDRPFAETSERLLTLLEQMEGWAEGAYRQGEQLRSRMGVGESQLIAKEIVLEIGEAAKAHASTTVPISWSASGTAGLFPRMAADLVVAPIGPEQTQVSFRGTYEPPLGAVGRMLDKAVLHRIAEASVKAFIDQIAEALQKESVPKSVG